MKYGQFKRWFKKHRLIYTKRLKGDNPRGMIKTERQKREGLYFKGKYYRTDVIAKDGYRVNFELMAKSIVNKNTKKPYKHLGL